MNYVEYDERDIQALEYEETINSDNKILGSCEIGNAKIQLLNTSNEYSDFKDKWIKTPLGNFKIYEVEPIQEKVNIGLSCYDVMCKLDTLYDSSLYTFPLTYKEWRNAIFDNCNIEYDDSNFPNCDSILDKEPYLEDNSSNRAVISKIAVAGSSFVCKDNDDKVYFRWFTNTTHIINDWLDLTTEKESTLPIEQVIIGRSGGDDIKYPFFEESKEVTSLRIDNNYVLDPQDTTIEIDKRNERIVPIYNRVKDFSFIPFIMSNPDVEDKLSIMLGDKVSYVDLWDNELTSYIMTKKTTYLGGNLTDSNNYSIILSAEETKETSDEYSYTNKSIKEQIIEVSRKADKANGTIEDCVKKEEVIASLNMAIENGQGVVRFVSNQFLVEADNLKIDQYGSVQMSNAEIVGGNIELFDNGTRDGSSIKIHTKIDYGTPITVGTDLSNKKLAFNFDENTALPEDIETRKYYTLLKTNNFQMRLYMIDHTELSGFKAYHFYYNYLDSSSQYKIATILKYTDGRPNKIIKAISDLQLNETAGTVTELSNYDLNSEIVITDQIDKVTNISGYGIDTIIAPRFNYTWDDMAYILEKLENNGTFSKNDIFKYDLNLDGVVDMDDYYNVQWFVLNDITIENPARLKINTQNAKDNLILTDGYGTDRVAIDFSGMRFKGNTHFSIENGFGEEVVSVGADGIYIDKNIMSNLCQNQILWQANSSTGGYYMTAEHNITLSEKVSEQAHGIILVWWAFNPSTQSLVGGPVAQQVIPKYLISDNSTTFHQDMHYANFTYSGTKVVYITDSSISGNDGNTAVGTGGSGIKYNNNRFVLSYVIGF